MITIDGAQGRDPGRRGQDDRAGAVRRLRDPDGLGRRGAAAEGARQRRDRRSTPRTARQFGAEGIGLCRTEHMFFDDARIAAVREMILADDEPGRRAALAKILPMQRGDFVRAVHHHGGPAGHHPPARPAAARVPAAHRGGPGGGGRGHRPRRRQADAPGRASCARPTRCSATAAAAWASPIPRSTRCRCARSSRRRCEVAAVRQAARRPGDHASAGRQGRGDGLPARAHRPGGQGR